MKIPRRRERHLLRIVHVVVRHRAINGACGGLTEYVIANGSSRCRRIRSMQ